MEGAGGAGSHPRLHESKARARNGAGDGRDGREANRLRTVPPPTLSRKTDLLKPSPTLGITAKANAMKAEGIDVVSFGAGEPDFNTPEPIRAAAHEALESGMTKYTPSAGIPALREAIARKLLRENGLAYPPAGIVVSCGAKHSLYNAFQVLLDPGDEVILLAPYWMTYADGVRLAGGVPRAVATRGEDGFVPTMAALAAAIGPRTKAIVVNSPSNPTGALLPDETLREIAELALRHGLWIVADEIYERIVYGGAKAPSIAALAPEVQRQTVTIGGCSKTYAMTGWRIGFAAAPEPVAKAMSTLQDSVTSNPTSFAQAGAAVAFDLPESAVEAMRAEFEARRDLIVGLLNAVPGFACTTPGGAFYAFPNVEGALRPGEDDLAFTDALLAEARVAVVPGGVFEGPGHIRLSYATGRETIERGVERIARFVRERA